METLISVQELHDAIKELKSNKTPGNNGYGSEFYKIFKLEVTEPLLNTCNHVLLSKEMPLSWAEATIIVIPKGNKDSSQPESYRPISLLNFDMEIFTKALVNRLKKIIAFYIKTDQTGFIPRRSFTDNVRRTLNIINHCKLEQKESINNFS